MPVSKARWLAGGIAVTSVILMTAAMALAYADRHSVPASLSNWDFGNLSTAVGDLTIPAIAVIVAARRPRNPIGWLALAAGLALALTTFANSYGQHALLAAPGSLPAGRAAMWVNNAIFIIPVAAVAFVFLLFPTGRLRSRRWRPAAWFVGAAFTFVLVATAVGATRFYDEPFANFSTQNASVLQIELLLTPAGLLVAVVALAIRFVRSVGEERLQLKWLAASAVFAIIVFVPDVLTSSTVTIVLFNLAGVGVSASIAIAVLKYRLYDIDIVISKAIQYGVLAAFITAVYAALVVGVGAAVGDQHSVWLSAIAAGVAAIAFQPVRQRAAQLANRLVYGRRATPYQLLSEFARRIGGTFADEDVLPQMARIVAAGTGAARVVVWLRLAGELRPAATAGTGPDTGPADTSASGIGP